MVWVGGGRTRNKVAKRGQKPQELSLTLSLSLSLSLSLQFALWDGFMRPLSMIILADEERERNDLLQPLTHFFFFPSPSAAFPAKNTDTR